MSNFLPWLLLLFLAVAGWYLSRRRPELARQLARGVAIIPAVILVGLAFSGCLLPGPTVAEFHRWSGHAIVIAMWLAAPLAIGVSLTRTNGQSIGRAGLLLLALFVTTLAAFTGYLDPTNAGEETKNRFLVLHKIVLPAMLAAILAVWCYIFRFSSGEHTPPN